MGEANFGTSKSVFDRVVQGGLIRYLLGSVGRRPNGIIADLMHVTFNFNAQVKKLSFNL